MKRLFLKKLWCSVSAEICIKQVDQGKIFTDNETDVSSACPSSSARVSLKIYLVAYARGGRRAKPA